MGKLSVEPEFPTSLAESGAPKLCFSICLEDQLFETIPNTSGFPNKQTLTCSAGIASDVCFVSPQKQKSNSKLLDVWWALQKPQDLTCSGGHMKRLLSSSILELCKVCYTYVLTGVWLMSDIFWIYSLHVS